LSTGASILQVNATVIAGLFIFYTLLSLTGSNDIDNILNPITPFNWSNSQESSSRLLLSNDELVKVIEDIMLRSSNSTNQTLGNQIIALIENSSSNVKNFEEIVSSISIEELNAYTSLQKQNTNNIILASFLLLTFTAFCLSSIFVLRNKIKLAKLNTGIGFVFIIGYAFITYGSQLYQSYQIFDSFNSYIDKLDEKNRKIAEIGNQITVIGDELVEKFRYFMNSSQISR
jgi:hypothetical protein